MDNIFLYGFLVWIVILMAAVLNGTARDFLYKKRLGKKAADQISTIILCAVIFIIAYIFLRIGDFGASNMIYLSLGFMWMLLTIAFEFLFFHYVMKHPWKELLENYKIHKGNLWILVLLSCLFAPFVAAFLI